MKDAITWFDIPTIDFNRAVKFYSDILGQKIRVDAFMRHGFFPMDETGGVGGNLVPPGPGYKPCANGTRVYLSCQGILMKSSEEWKRPAERLLLRNSRSAIWAG